MVTDAHIHLVPAMERMGCLPQAVGDGYAVCSCAHDPAEFERQERIAASVPFTVVQAFGLHPQKPCLCHAEFLGRLLTERRIQAVGECGFDLFSAEFRGQLAQQEEAWHLQLALARQHGVPIVVHDRKALDLLFRDARDLRGLRAVVLHSFAFGPREAAALLSKGINAYFSFGKPLLNGNKKSMACVAQLDPNRLLFETDAPYQTLRGEQYTGHTDILRVYQAAAALRGIPAADLTQTAAQNFFRAFSVG